MLTSGLTRQHLLWNFGTPAAGNGLSDRRVGVRASVGAVRELARLCCWDPASATGKTGRITKMRTLMMGFLMMAVLWLAPNPAKAEEFVHGVWKVIKFQQKVLESGQVIEPFGPEVRGYYIYGKSHFTRLVTSAKRAVNSVPPKDEEILALYKSMYAYGGTYVQEGKKLTVKREAAWREDFVGGGATTTLEFSGKSLTMTSPTFKNIAGKDAVAIIALERLE